MTAEQLEAARAERMRHNGHGTLTLEDARTWIEETGFCLFLPRRQYAASTAPSFVEAILGRREATPDAKTIALAEELLVRLELDGVAVRLNLQGQPGEQPDFVVAGWVLPYVYALRGDRDWRRNPQLTGSRQVSPLAVQAYKLIEAGDSTISELTHSLGREVTEVAVLRSITELWQQLRIIPVIDAPGVPARWQLLRHRFQKAIAEGASTSQVTAISVLASIYLQAVIAATMEEVEIFLSALTARSKVREVIRGLVATRQVHSITLGHSPHFYVAGTLPEFSVAPSIFANGNLPGGIFGQEEEPVIAAPVVYKPVPEAIANPTPAGPPFATPRPQFAPRPPAGRSDGERPATRSFGDRPSRPAFASRPVGDRPAHTGAPRMAADRPQRPNSARPGSTRPSNGHPASSRPTSARPGNDRPQRPATGRPMQGRPMQDRPMQDRPAGTRPTGDRPMRPARPTGARPTGDRPVRPGTARPGTARSGSDRPSSTRPGSARPGAARPSGARPGTDRPSRPAAPRSDRPANAVRGGGDRPARPARPASARPSGSRPSADRPNRPAGTRPAGERPNRPAQGGSNRTASKPAMRRNDGPARPASKSAAKPGDKPAWKNKPAGKPAERGLRPTTDTRGKSAAKPAWKAKPSGKPTGKPGAKAPARGKSPVAASRKPAGKPAAKKRG